MCPIYAEPELASSPRMKYFQSRPRLTKKGRGHPYIRLVDVVLDSTNVESIAQGN